MNAQHDTNPSDNRAFQPRTIAVDIDDTLNNYSEILSNHEFQYSDSYHLSEEDFRRYIALIKSAAPDKEETLCTQYSHFKIKMQIECHKLASARPDAVEFMQWLKAHDWRVVICTYRDLRRTDYTQQWLAENRIPYDYIFAAQNKLAFCKLWQIQHLIDDDPFNIICGSSLGINTYYPVMAKHQLLLPNAARGFHSFEEVKQWISA